MKTSTVFIGACGIVAGVLLQPAVVCAQGSDEAQIRALEDSFAAGVRAKDPDAIMKVYVPDQTLFQMEVVQPRQCAGALSCRNDSEHFLKDLDGPVKFDITDL